MLKMKEHRCVIVVDYYHGWHDNFARVDTNKFC